MRAILLFVVLAFCLGCQSTGLKHFTSGRRKPAADASGVQQPKPQEDFPAYAP
ncbi:MAG TPA: hypothetical protein VGZ22_02055 [Isosphaeraceae bacterium]|jgi:hypothetical protein|nr:hypothetical protein [Isosphaeraceae bacterium]